MPHNATGQHDCDTFAARQAERLLQVARELHRQFVELRVAERRAHVAVGWTMRVFFEDLFEQLSDGPVRRRRQVFRDARWIGLQPDFFH